MAQSLIKEEQIGGILEKIDDPYESDLYNDGMGDIELSRSL
jgi:hypothetical protein